MIYRQTYMDEMPANCVECKQLHCNIPMKADGVTFLKSCVNKRHKSCPLITVDELKQRIEEGRA